MQKWSFQTEDLHFLHLEGLCEGMRINSCQFSGYAHGSRLGEDVRVDVHHQVASRRVLHHKTHVLRRLEAREQVDQERMVRHVHDLEDALLTHQTAGQKKGRHERQRQEEKDQTKNVSLHLKLIRNRTF